jgi:tetratricopeptide (TPR) repeat protein
MAATTSAVGAPIEFLAQDPVEAERLLRSGLKDLERLGATHDTGGLAAYLAEALYQQGRISEARSALESATERAAQDVVYVVRIRTMRAKLFAHDRLPEKAVMTAQEAVRIADSTDSPNLRAEARFNLGEVLAECGAGSEAAASTFRDAVQLFDAKGNMVAARRTQAKVSQL